MSITQFPASPKTLARARDYVEKKREEVGRTSQARDEMMDAMLGSISETLGGMGVSSLVIGDQHIALSEPEARSAQVEARWTQALNEGKFVGALQAGFIACRMFRGDEYVRMQDRRLDELVDLDRLRALAPDAVVYGPGEIVPWPNLISSSAFSVWVDDRAQFDALWAGVKQWMKTAWFDHTMVQHKERFRAAEMFDVLATYNIAPDLAWREAQFKRAEALAEQAQELGAWDTLAQQEIKKTLGSLLQVESHPLLGVQVAPLIETLTPMLAFAMDGKDRARELAEASSKARDHCWKGFSSIQSSWKDHTPASPLPQVIAPPKPARKPKR